MNDENLEAPLLMESARKLIVAINNEILINELYEQSEETKRLFLLC